MIQYFDGMGNNRTQYVNELERKVASLELEIEELKRLKVKKNTSAKTK